MVCQSASKQTPSSQNFAENTERDFSLSASFEDETHSADLPSTETVLFPQKLTEAAVLRFKRSVSHFGLPIVWAGLCQMAQAVVSNFTLSVNSGEVAQAAV